MRRTDFRFFQLSAQISLLVKCTKISLKPRVMLYLKFLIFKYCTNIRADWTGNCFVVVVQVVVVQVVVGVLVVLDMVVCNGHG